MKTFDTVILGAGWAGLLYTYKYIKNNKSENLAIIDKSSKGELGGLLRSEIIDGFTFDTGGPHLLFSKDPEILREILKILGKNSIKHKRNNFIWYDNKFIPYPFENGMFLLDKEKRFKFSKSVIEKMIYIAKNQEWKPVNFLDWIYGFFGEEMAKEYLIPYNEKIWKTSLDSIAADWVFTPGRLPFPELDDILKATAGLPTTGYKEQAYFYYPKNGGIQSLYNSMLNKILEFKVTLITNENVRSIKKYNNFYNINEKITAKKIVNTIPLPELINLLDGPDCSKNLYEMFDYNSVVIVGIAINKKSKNQTTIYVPDPKIIFHRYTWMDKLAKPKNSNESNIIAEITIHKNESIDVKKITEKVIGDFLNMEVIDDEKNVLFTKIWINKYGYPIYTLNHNEIRGKTFEILNKMGIKSVGRWGSWHYWNTDMVFKAVMQMENEVKYGNIKNKLYNV